MTFALVLVVAEPVAVGKQEEECELRWLLV
jgi:hypothetical protein